MSEQNISFEYNYSAKEQAEIKSIRERYVQPSETQDKMEQLRRLDAGVTKKGTVVSLMVGIVGILIMGTGMSLVMTDLGALFETPYTYLVGIAVGLIGMIGVVSAYPLYTCITKKERERIAPEIIRLTDELMK